MRAFVLTDPALASQAGRFVWLELNTDLTANEPVLRKHEADALPTFLVVDPKDERVVLRWVGSFTVAAGRGLPGGGAREGERLRSARLARRRRARSRRPTLRRA